MNILIVAPTFPPDKSVGAVRMRSLARYLISQKDSVTVLTNLKNEELEITGVSYCFVNAKIEGRYMERFKANENLYLSAFHNLTMHERFDVVLISGGPFYTFKVAVAAKKREIPCILDFRDPWIFDYRDPKDFFKVKNLLTKLAELPKERKAVKAADAVVTVTDGWRDSFRKFYPLCKDKFIVIPNGYDDEQLIDLVPSKYEKRKKLTIGVFGKLFYYTERYSRTFLAGMKNFEQAVGILQVGEKEPIATKLLTEYNISEDCLESTGFISYKDGMEVLMNADAYLIIDVRKNAIGTKIYDYQYLDKPIIYVGPANTVLAKMVGESSVNFVCSSSKSVENALAAILNGSRAKAGGKAAPKSYSRSVQNKKWCDLLYEKL